MSIKLKNIFKALDSLGIIAFLFSIVILLASEKITFDFEKNFAEVTFLNWVIIIFIIIFLYLIIMVLKYEDNKKDNLIYGMIFFETPYGFYYFIKLFIKTTFATSIPIILSYFNVVNALKGFYSTILLGKVIIILYLYIIVVIVITILKKIYNNILKKDKIINN